MKKSIMNFLHLITLKNIWVAINWVIDIIGILFLVWMTLSLLYLGVLLLSAFATTSFSDGNSWAELSKSFFNLSIMGILAIIALAISGINSISKFITIHDQKVDINNLEVDLSETKEELRMKTLELDALKESLGIE